MIKSSEWPLNIISGLRCYTWLERPENKLKENVFPWSVVSIGPEFKPGQIWHFKAMCGNEASTWVLPNFFLGRTYLDTLLWIFSCKLKVYFYRYEISKYFWPKIFDLKFSMSDDLLNRAVYNIVLYLIWKRRFWAFRISKVFCPGIIRSRDISIPKSQLWTHVPPRPLYQLGQFSVCELQ